MTPDLLLDHKDDVDAGNAAVRIRGLRQLQRQRQYWRVGSRGALAGGAEHAFGFSPA